MGGSSDIEFAQSVERIEADAWAELQLCLPDDIRAQLGVRVAYAHGGVLLIASRSPALPINRTLGLGFESPLTSRVLEKVIQVYLASEVHRFVLQWSPAARAGSAAQLLTRHGFMPLPHTAKMVRATDKGFADDGRPSEILVREIGADAGPQFERIVAEPLGVPDGHGAGVRSTVGRPRWRFYLAFEQDEPIAGAALYVQGEHGWCGLAATVRGARGRGAQHALLRRRIADAKSVGCRWVSADTLVADLPGPAQSRRNLERAGFTLPYERPNYVWEWSTPTQVR